MKTTLRIPCKEQYAYVEVELNEESSETIKKVYDELTSVMKEISSPELVFCEYLVNLMDSNMQKWGTVEEYNSMNENQKKAIQSIKRYYKRLQSVREEMENSDAEFTRKID